MTHPGRREERDVPADRRETLQLAKFLRARSCLMFVRQSNLRDEDRKRAGDPGRLRGRELAGDAARFLADQNFRREGELRIFQPAQSQSLRDRAPPARL